MTCEDCAAKKEEITSMLDEIRTSQIQAQAGIQWLVDTVSQLATGFQNMMNAGGPLAMLKELRKGGKKNGD